MKGFDLCVTMFYCVILLILKHIAKRHNMRRTLHAGQLPSQTVIKRRRVDALATGSVDVELPSSRDAAQAAPVSETKQAPTSTPAAPPPRQEDLSSDEEDDDEAELLRERQRLAKLNERNQSAAASTSGVASYNSDVLFRRTVPASSQNNSAAAKFLRHSNLQASKDHRDFLRHYFR
jgi:type IV secretory pathway VirB10-like protein